MRFRAPGLAALALAVAAMATGLVATTPVVPVAQARSCDRPSGPLVAYGHSYLLSPGLGGATVSYPTLVAAALHVKPVIRAVNGGTTKTVEGLVFSGPTKWVPGSSDLVLIDSAINDIRFDVPAAQWTAQLRHVLSAFTAAPVPTILLLRPLPVRAATHPGHDPEVIAAYVAAQKKVAEEFSAVRIVDASSGWNPRTDLSPVDGIHPNPAGEVHLAQAVRTAARRALCAP